MKSLGMPEVAEITSRSCSLLCMVRNSSACPTSSCTCLLARSPGSVSRYVLGTVGRSFWRRGVERMLETIVTRRIFHLLLEQD